MSCSIPLESARAAARSFLQLINKDIRLLESQVIVKVKAEFLVFLEAKNISLRGIEISANHVKSVKDGFVYARATPLHKGRTTQLWQIRITNEANELVSLVKLTTIAFYS